LIDVHLGAVVTTPSIFGDSCCCHDYVLCRDSDAPRKRDIVSSGVHGIGRSSGADHPRFTTATSRNSLQDCQRKPRRQNHLTDLALHSPLIDHTILVLAIVCKSPIGLLRS